jgi:hypothetical protein
LLSRWCRLLVATVMEAVVVQSPHFCQQQLLDVWCTK